MACPCLCAMSLFRKSGIGDLHASGSVAQRFECSVEGVELVQSGDDLGAAVRVGGKPELVQFAIGEKEEGGRGWCGLLPGQEGEHQPRNLERGYEGETTRPIIEKYRLKTRAKQAQATPNNGEYR